MSFRYHQATFDLLGKRPRPLARAAAAIEARERALGIAFPASLREFYVGLPPSTLRVVRGRPDGRLGSRLRDPGATAPAPGFRAETPATPGFPQA